MELKLAKEIVMHIHSGALEALELYIKEREQVIKDSLTTETNIDNIRKHQGAYDEIKRLGKIREYALLVTKQEK